MFLYVYFWINGINSKNQLNMKLIKHFQLLIFRGNRIVDWHKTIHTFMQV